MDFQLPFQVPPPKGEKNDGVSIVERQGYIPADVQIMQMIEAGQSLGAYREAEYDGVEGEDIPVDPTRHPGYDMADAAQDAMAVKARLRSQAEEANAKADQAAAAAEAAKKENPPKVE